MEPDIDFEEEYKLESSEDNNKNIEDPESWIDINQTKDGFSNITIKEMIEVWLLERAYKEFELKELNNKVNRLRINSQINDFMRLIFPFSEFLKNL